MSSKCNCIAWNTLLALVVALAVVIFCLWYKSDVFEVHLLFQTQTAADFVRSFSTGRLGGEANISLWIPATSMIANCGSSPHKVPYVVCLRHVEWPARLCKWSGSINAGSSIKVTAIGKKTIFAAGLSSSYTKESCLGIGPRTVGSPVCECQYGNLEINDVDVHRIQATVLQRGCAWEIGGNLSWVPEASWTTAVTLTMLSNTSCPIDSKEPPLPRCFGRHAAGLPGRWVAQSAAGASEWARRAFDEGLGTIDGFTPAIRKCEGVDRKRHAPFVWMPWGCQMLFFNSSNNIWNPRRYPDCGRSCVTEITPVRLIHCLKHYQDRNKRVYVIGDSHGREMWMNWMARVKPEIKGPFAYTEMLFLNYCDALPAMPKAELIILAIGNWDAALYLSRRKTLAQTSRCIDSLVAKLAKMQASGTEVRLGTPVSFCCGRRSLVQKGMMTAKQIKQSRGLVREFTWKATQLLGQAVRRSARHYGVPLWDILRITNGMEMNNEEDLCNHYNGQMYHILVQVLCNSFTGGPT